ncbi:DUF2332 domain-containing protein [Pseudokineococcus sp. 1T1Z-3]|uniref:DUF2332 domain-containing protein n=1 Tax=Pseudokineococcus sp. 1T1Z-3 TaxID=3132745 RepID=UPI0030AE6288
MSPDRPEPPPAPDSGAVASPDVVAHARQQAAACRRLGAPFTGALCDAAADDVERGGPLAAVLAGDPWSPGPSALALRFVGALQRLVLAGQAPELAALYPSEHRPDGDAVAAAALLPAVVGAHGATLRAGLGVAPQTNEVGRTAALWGGLLGLVADGVGAGLAGPGGTVPVALVDLGSSAGLLLQADRVRMTGADGSACGPEGSPVRLEGAWDVAPWAPGPPPLVRVVERDGVDVAPLDPADPDHARRLRSFVWPEQRARVRRLEGALALARAHPVRVRRASAGDLARELTLRPGVVTVLWHAVVRQYVPAEELDALERTLHRLGEQASAAAPLVHLAVEPGQPPDGGVTGFPVTASAWGGPGATGRPRRLGAAGPHGPPVRWETRG